MLPSFLIFLREGLEGSMIVAIMCTYLASVGRRDLFRSIFIGAAAALALSAGAAVGMYVFARDSFIGSTAQTWFETITFLLAVAVLTYMTFWMKQNARHMNSSIKARITTAVAGGSVFALALLAFATVGREAVETAIFLLAIAFQSSWRELLVGAAAGLAISLAASFAIYRLGVKMNLRRFFTFIGAALMIVAAGLLSNAVQNLQELGVVPGSQQTLWNTGRLVADNSPLGDILHGLLGYAASPTALQVVAWAVFLGIGLAAFFGRPAAVVARLTSRA